MSDLSPLALLYDADGNPVKVAQEGNLFLLGVRDPEQTELLRHLVQEIKKTNFYLSQIVGVDMPGYGLKED